MLLNNKKRLRSCRLILKCWEYSTLKKENNDKTRKGFNLNRKFTKTNKKFTPKKIPSSSEQSGGCRCPSAAPPSSHTYPEKKTCH